MGPIDSRTDENGGANGAENSAMGLILITKNYRRLAVNSDGRELLREQLREKVYMFHLHACATASSSPVILDLSYCTCTKWSLVKID